MNRRTLPLLACALAVLAAACGSSNAATIPPPRYVEKSAAIAAGDNICTTLAADQQRLITDFNAKYPHANADEVHDFTINTLIPRIEQGVGDFHRIGEPTKDRLGWDVILGRLDVNLTWFKAMGPADLMTSLAASPFTSEWAKFNDYGFKVCGKPFA